MRGVETAGDDEDSAAHGPDIRHLAEDHEAEDTDPDELGVRKRREHGSVGVTKGETIHWPAVDATPMKTPNRMSCQLGATQTNGTSAEITQTPTIDE